ncbi:osmoprotectant NAGGN system M42 family peptidase [Marichromatium gracile]|uniref:osmoprotectant NAGGN system M42 family peptidase n=1 Tax=Marichromatium TaxID=85076 RepID=UPI000F3B61FF|nr:MULTISPECIES: osmoprotectant NAGGN system M42 family peptidase [Marichromatium]MCF1181824.1 osmoprotectant NAGGN system M42 family peptidase [Marichromatium gracile]RNE93337.1 osmoprotectant NAGGN system M42 family peptidase [Marichromatium sp. AB32]
MKLPAIDSNYLVDILLKLLFTPSPSGYTDRVVHLVCEELERLGVPFELTRRGAIRATLEGRVSQPDRAVVAHIDTLGAMVKGLKENGRLQLVPVGHWNARFAEGARATLFTDTGQLRGTILPMKASGHTFGPEIDNQPGGWDHVEFRIDTRVSDLHGLLRLGVHVGDFLAIDTCPEITDTGFINARHLDDKAGAAVLLATIEAVQRERPDLPVDCHPLFTISEEVGSGASAALHQDVAEMLTIDNGTTAPGQNSSEFGVTIAMADQSGPFDYHLTHRVIQLCQEFTIPHQRDVFRYYRSDSAAALEAGNDVRTALVTFGVDASHGYERIHLDALESLARLVGVYMQAPPLFSRDRYEMGPRAGFPTQPG